MSGETIQRHETSATQSLDAYLEGHVDRSSSRSVKRDFPTAQGGMSQARPLWGGITSLSASHNSALRACEISSSELESLGRSLDSMARDFTSQGPTTSSQTLSDPGLAESRSQRLERLRRSLDSRAPAWSGEPILIDRSKDNRVLNFEEARQKLRERANPFSRRNDAKGDQETAWASTHFDSDSRDRRGKESQRENDSQDTRGCDNCPGTTPSTSSNADENERDGDKGTRAGEEDSPLRKKCGDAGGGGNTAGLAHLQKVKEVLERPFFQNEHFDDFRKAVLESHPRRRWNALNTWIREGQGTPFDPDGKLQNQKDDTGHKMNKEDSETVLPQNSDQGEEESKKENMQVLDNGSKSEVGKVRSESERSDPNEEPSMGVEENQKEMTSSPERNREGVQTSQHSPTQDGIPPVDPSWVSEHDSQMESSEEESASLQEMCVQVPDLYIARKRFQHLTRASQSKQQTMEHNEVRGNSTTMESGATSGPQQRMGGETMVV